MTDLLKLSLIEQLHPQRVGYGRDGKMAAIVACILGQTWTGRVIERLLVTSDGFVLAQVDGFANDILGTFAELSRNWQRLCEFAHLTLDERTLARRLFKQATGRAMVRGKVPRRALPPTHARPS